MVLQSVQQLRLAQTVLCDCVQGFAFRPCAGYSGLCCRRGGTAYTCTEELWKGLCKDGFATLRQKILLSTSQYDSQARDCQKSIVASFVIQRCKMVSAHEGSQTM
eukprot:3908963-Amphidinium_carterae.1